MKFVYKQYAFLGPESTSAAEASECAAEQNKFWPFHDLLFQKQGAEGGGTFSKANLKRYARDITGLDATAFDTCFDSGKYTQKVADEKAEGIRLGVNATPTLFVDDQMQQAGLPPKDTLYARIQERLK